MYRDHEFDPVTPEEQARREQDEEFARRVRREVLRMERGEAEEDIRADEEREAEERAEAEERERAGAPPQVEHLLAVVFGLRSSCARAFRNTIPTC